MKKKVLFCLVLIAAVVIAGLIIFFIQNKNPSASLQSGLTRDIKETEPSETFIDYSDPAGFSFSYPDNLSISKAEIEDPELYADLQLFSKDVSGSLKIRIADSKFKSMDDWLKANNISASNTPKEVELGNLKALEVKTNDRLLLGALDQGVLFTIEMPLIEQDFWIKVYEKILSGFEFSSPDTIESTGVLTTTEEDVIFEGEEVVE